MFSSGDGRFGSLAVQISGSLSSDSPKSAAVLAGRDKTPSHGPKRPENRHMER